MKRILLCSDWHCGSRVGLTPPEWQYKPPRNASHRAVKLDNQRRALWAWFVKHVRSFGEFHAAAIVGDSLDGQGTKQGGTDQLTTDRAEQIEMALAVAKHIPALTWRHVEGTPYHAGPEESWEGQFAKALGAPYSAEAHLNVDGLKVACKHIIGNTKSPASRYTALSNAEVRQKLWSFLDQQPVANLIVRAHIHRCQGIVNPAANFQAWTLPGLQGLGSRYGAVQCDGLPIDFGFLVLEVQDGPDSWGIVHRIAPLKLQACSEDVL